MTGSIRALRERNAADRAAYAAEILARAAELEDDPIAMNDALLAEPSPPVRSAEPGAAILHRVRNNEPAAAADEAAALDPAIDAVLWLSRRSGPPGGRSPPNSGPRSPSCAPCSICSAPSAPNLPRLSPCRSATRRSLRERKGPLIWRA